MTNFNFNSRETYLAYRADWKARYKAQTLLIRGLKPQHLEEQRSGKGGWKGYELRMARQAANQMMIELAEAKQFKNDQLAALQSVEA